MVIEKIKIVMKVKSSYLLEFFTLLTDNGFYNVGSESSITVFYGWPLLQKAVFG